MKSFLRRREDIQNIGKIGNLNMNRMVIYIISTRNFDTEFYADSEFEVKKIFLPTHLREKRVSKNSRRRNQKISILLSFQYNSDSKYTHMSPN